MYLKDVCNEMDASGAAKLATVISTIYRYVGEKLLNKEVTIEQAETTLTSTIMEFLHLMSHDEVFGPMMAQVAAESRARARMDDENES